mmetsp:Transcript_32788/g.36516  ORF Transcript_32788/g.36516 Transcript_32788/m.36516 type:complete len:383 (+) Transcript_32788:78-1226(+)
MFLNINKLLYCRRTISIAATTTSIGVAGLIIGTVSCGCESSATPSIERNNSNRLVNNTTSLTTSSSGITIHQPSIWFRLLARIGIISHNLPRLLTPNDPAFKISKRFLRRRQNDEEKMRQLLTEEVPKIARNDPNFEHKIGALRNEILQLAHGKGVTAQMREDFLIRYGCTGFNDDILNRLVELCANRGVVEIGAGHGQWEKALSCTYGNFLTKRSDSSNPDANNNESTFSKLAHKKTEKRKRFDFVLAYDNNSNLPLNTHIYNQYTQPHHDYFGKVQNLESKIDLYKVLRSWACRGRALLLVYPPPGPMAIDSVKTYIDAAPVNDTLIYVGEGRGGANGDDALFDVLENGEWTLVEVIQVLLPPGNKGCEKLYILHHKAKQ